MALTSCENETINDGIETKDAYTLNFVAGAPESRTSVEVDGTTATFSWAEEGETFTFVQNTTAGLKKGTNVTFANNAGLAEITATFTEAESPIVAVYPENAWASSNNTDFNKAKLIVAKDQNILDGTFDPNADLLVSKVVEPENVTDTHSLQFGRVVAVGKMTLKNLPVVGEEVINKVNFSIDSENALTGRLYIDLATAEVSEWGYANNAYNEVNLRDGNMAVAATNDIYFTCMPATVAAGETFTVVVTTNVATYTHSVTIPDGKSIQFAAGRVSSFGVNMADAERVANSGLALPWSESFDSEDLSKYDVVSGSSTTQVYPDDTLAGGEAGEILISKGGGSLTATFASDGTAKTLNFWFKSNKDVVVLSSDTEGVTITKLTSTGYTVTLAEGVELFELTLVNNTSDNARVDDIVLTTEAPEVASLSIVDQKISFTAGDDFVFNGTVNAVYENGVTEEINDYIVDSSAVNMANAGEYTVTITYNGVNATYTINVAAAGVETETFDLSVTGTHANSVITWVENGVTITQAKGNGSSAPNASYTMASNARIYQGNTLTFSCATNITNIEIVTASGNYYGSTASVNVGTLTNPKTSGCTITWTGSAKEIILTNGSGSGGHAIKTTKITITYEVSGQGGGETPVVETLATPTNVEAIAEGKDVLIAWDEVANATSYYVTCGTQEATVTECTAEFTMPNYGTEYNITVVAKADGYNDSVAATSSVTTEADPNAGSVKTATFDWVNGGYANDTVTITVGDITWTGSKGSHASTSARIYSNSLRTYAGNSVKFEAADGYVITSITGIDAFNFTGSQQVVEFTGLEKKTYTTAVVVTYEAAN